MTGMEIANASLLDEGTAASEAMTMFYRLRKGEKKLANKFFVSKKSFPQTIELMKTRSTPLGIELVIGDINNFEFSDDFFGIFLQYPDSDGNISDISKILESAKQSSIFSCVASDLMSLAMFTPPGDMGADVVVGNSQKVWCSNGIWWSSCCIYATKKISKDIYLVELLE